MSVFNNFLVSNFVFLFQKEIVLFKLIVYGEQKELEIFRNVLLVLVYGLMLVNEIVYFFIIVCLGFFEELVYISERLEIRVLRGKVNCVVERNFNKRKICKNKFVKIKIRID